MNNSEPIKHEFTYEAHNSRSKLTQPCTSFLKFRWSLFSSGVNHFLKIKSTVIAVYSRVIAENNSLVEHLQDVN